MTLAPAIARMLRRLAGDRRGNVVTTFALAAPVIAILVLGAVDLASVSSDKSNLQEVADSAALMAAKQMGVADNGGLAERVKSVIAGQLAEMDGRLSYQTAVEFNTADGLATVSITANRASFFVNLLPPGGWNFSIVSKAQRMGTTPLCVLSFGSGVGDIISLQNSAQLLAPGCMVHSNADVTVDGSAALSAGVVQASGLATGAISPDPQTDAPAIDDPFTDLTVSADGGACSPLDLVGELLPIILAPGVHCGNIIALKSVQITLLPGEHIFRKGKLELKENSTLMGDNVVLVFGKDSRFHFMDNSKINLKGRRQGAYAGFVIATTRDNTNTFEISSSAARELLGTVYIPNSELRIRGQNRVADQSAWTVIVAKSLQLRDNPDLVINKNYSGSNVPVPDGVGPVSAANVRLTE
jgi:Flp pilus assembly protein TadG